MTSSVSLSEGEFGGKTDLAVLSLLNTLAQMQPLTFEAPQPLVAGRWEGSQ